MTFQWITVTNQDQLETLYRTKLPFIAAAARNCGYAIGVHGSLRRDMDLIAVPWVNDATDKDILVRAIHQAACGIEQQSYQWEQKPGKRVATCFPICFPEGMENKPSLGHIDLSVVEW